MQSVQDFSHDRHFGSIWSTVVDKFYSEVPEDKNLSASVAAWLDATEGWVPNTTRDRYTEALKTLIGQYYQNFSPDDGARGKGKSELKVENDKFLGYLDGLSDDEIVHECKSTSRPKQLSEKLWQIGNSLQIKLYCVLTKAKGYRIEMAFKDAPQGIVRADVVPVTAEQLVSWEKGLNTLADHIYSLGTDPDNYICNSGGCAINTKNFSSPCSCAVLCEQGLNDMTKIGYKLREGRK